MTTSSTHVPGFRRRTAALLGALLAGVLVVSGCSVYDAPLPGGAKLGDHPMTIKVLFRDVLDLVPQSTVKVNDVTVGKVTKIKLKGYVAEVTIKIPGDVKLPDNARAEIRQTSLLGEKFVSLSKPEDPSTGLLSSGDSIGLDRTGRNPEVEEVLGALSLLLNGGGVGQLKTIVSELNNTFDGRESDIRSVLDQIRSFMGQLDTNKAAIVTAIENTNRLAVQLRKQDGTIKRTLDEVPAVLKSVDRQRADLVKLLQALSRLSGVGVRVIKASKESTINSLRELAPVLDGFAKAGENLPKAFQVFLTYPFVDEAVGRDPQVARNLHQGDYTNLSVNLNLDLAKLTLPEVTIPVPTAICQAVRAARANAKSIIEALPGLTSTQKKNLETVVLAQIEDNDCNITTNTVRQYIAAALAALTTAVTGPLCDALGSNNPLCVLLQDPTALPTLSVGGLGGTTSGGGVGGVLGGVTQGLGIPRAQLGKGYQAPQQIDPFGLAARGLDPGIGTMLLQGVARVR
jgi:phospholipid/cholesterol/gamma-HCH transport system substrate-binding protein